jgi:hypothetical protein
MMTTMMTVIIIIMRFRKKTCSHVEHNSLNTYRSELVPYEFEGRNGTRCMLNKHFLLSLTVVDIMKPR